MIVNFVPRTPLPSETNVVLWFYIDLFDQGVGTLAYYLMIATSVLLFIGPCLYIGGMVEDLKQTLAELKGDSDSMAKQLSIEIAFHNQLLE